eukprot:CAMPEP_0115584626 /NCGR_PEP_ID=MMETSP0272-20121206/6780_1 /TAXON_ID=71861 /ORGANISM="Scrippsiella trochoidea, Strain CCMP3099" /LENGTH=92 /DNA_ID=CAMNT_0003019665 /DNA_START=67 /DNA_END=341 /DNA_ORIENTATION=+
MAAAPAPIAAVAGGYSARSPPPLVSPMAGYPQRGVSPHRPPTPQNVHLGAQPRGVRAASPQIQRGVRPPASAQRSPTPPAQLGGGFRGSDSV